MEIPLEGRRVLRPQRPEDFELLVDPGAAPLEVFAQGDVLQRVPADADTQPEPPIREQVDMGGLLGDEGGLALRLHQDSGDELDLVRLAREVAEQRQRLVELVAVVVRSVPAALPVGVGAEDVVVREQVAVAQRLGPPGVLADGPRVGPVSVWGKVTPNSMGVDDGRRA